MKSAFRTKKRTTTRKKIWRQRRRQQTNLHIGRQRHECAVELILETSGHQFASFAMEENEQIPKTQVTLAQHDEYQIQGFQQQCALDLVKVALTSSVEPSRPFDHEYQLRQYHCPARPKPLARSVEPSRLTQRQQIIPRQENLDISHKYLSIHQGQRPSAI